MTNIKGTYIELYNSEKGEYEKIVQPFISSKKLYDALDMQEKAQNAKTEKEELDLALHYIEQLFDSPKVTFESILNGVASADLSETLQRIMSDVVGKKPQNRQERRNQKHIKKQNKN
ncbi:hypothetical protein MI410_09595 [Staphylococcus epidermidis]|mgnify:FL=1|uniref:phage tail assembly chaperone G n=1 Tax=Staphylococcus epidermidis TaxID=1282 RepID=UPI00136E42C4|nr:hypothetical protein [Staphylococcus epidermidis]MCG7838104.1 hypothetical protein [Staphylococcus epidermidis]MCG7843425.1 hypothetical protein [Staphylococcus epidermidis]MDK8622925.1 hypothetical protein [Staphylococcus epidermidis]NAM80319.1 hypothetical protein [Staphylococcus epidermidis]